eukprot:365778-Chlamydomonas_euryale.AAC.1
MLAAAPPLPPPVSQGGGPVAPSPPPQSMGLVRLLVRLAQAAQSVRLRGVHEVDVVGAARRPLRRLGRRACGEPRGVRQRDAVVICDDIVEPDSGVGGVFGVR